jgi:hypothetical protein
VLDAGLIISHKFVWCDSHLCSGLKRTRTVQFAAKKCFTKKWINTHGAICMWAVKSSSFVPGYKETSVSVSGLKMLRSELQMLECKLEKCVLERQRLESRG